MPLMAAALSAYSSGPNQVVIVGDDRAPFERALGRRYLPFTIALSVPRDRQRALAARVPVLAAMVVPDGRTAAYLCRDLACSQPVTTVADLETLLSGS